MMVRSKALFKQFLLLIGAFVFLVSCATHQTKLAEPRQLLKEGRYTEALALLKPLADKKSDNQLVYLMEYGTALQMAGQYKESNEVLLKADRLADQVDYHSVSNVTLAALGGEEMIQYKGESYEKLLINALIALNFTMMGRPDDALVEARRINEKINKIRLEGREDYEQNPFAHYLSGHLWESDRKFDDAYISFEKAYKLDGTNPYLPMDLIRASKRARRDDTHAKWKKEFPQVKEDPDWYDRNKGEIVVFIQQGWGPRKDFSPHNRRIPKLYPVHSVTQGVRADLFEGPAPAAGDRAAKKVESSASRIVYDVENVAIRTLDADYGWMVARKVGAFVAKEVVADQIRQKNELLGVLAWVGMHASDRADLRQWSTLPQTIQMIRIFVPPGTYHMTLQGVDGGGSPTGDRKENIPLTIRAGQKVFTHWRTLR